MKALTDDELKQLASNQRTLSEMMETIGIYLAEKFLYYLLRETKPYSEWEATIYYKKIWESRVSADIEKLDFARGVGPTPKAALTAAMEAIK
jgi:hypothetical protein